MTGELYNVTWRTKATWADTPQCQIHHMWSDCKHAISPLAPSMTAIQMMFYTHMQLKEVLM